MAEPQTVAELIEWFEAHFQCFLGPARAYFEIELGPEFGADQYYRGIYDTYAVKCADGEDAERKLVAAMYGDFKTLATTNDGASLFWRLPEKVVIERRELQKFGRFAASREIVEDCGLVLPASGYVVNDGGDWYQDAGKSVELVLRTRLHMPALATVPYHMITRKTEGAETLTI